MKKLIVSLSVIALFTLNVMAQDSAPEIKFDSKIYDYGTIAKGSDGNCEFVFKNIGKEPLIITTIQKSCGCTTPTWDQKPILPGQSSSIKVGYDTQRLGPFNKQITVISNATNSTEVLTIKGNVAENVQTPTSQK